MVSFTITAGIALLAAAASAAAVPTSPVQLEARQELPAQCSDYCSVSAGCICIKRPINCAATYLVDAGESCGTIVGQFNNFTAPDLYKWNPEIGQSCIGLRAYVPVCIGVPGYKYPGAFKGGDIVGAEKTPVPIQPSSVQNCTSYEYTDNKGVPTLGSILASNKITKKQWNSWNYPTQNSDEDWAAWAGYWSCIKA